MTLSSSDALDRGITDPDRWLVQQAQGGSADAFTQLYRSYYAQVLRIAKGILLDADESEDAVQEIFHLARRNLPRFDFRSRFSTWLFRVAVNHSIQHGRGLWKRKNVSLETAAEIGHSTEQNWDREVVQTALAQLKREDRAILILFYWHDLSLTEIGDVLNCNANAAKTRLFRARDRFRKIYEEMDA